MAFKDFAKASLRTATAIFLALLALVLAIAGFLWGKDLYEKKQAQPYETVKDWNIDMRDPLSLDFHARTKLIDGKLLMAIEANGYPDYVKAPRNREATFTFQFTGSDGFKVFSKPVKLTDFTSIIGKSGEPAGLAFQSDEYVGLDAYRRFSRLQVEWNVDPKATVPPPPTPAAAAQPLLDHCAPGLSKAERLRRLSQYGTVREAGNGEYTAGARSVYFMFDGSLINCR